MRKILSVAVMAIIAFTSCKRTDESATKVINGVEKGTEYVAGINLSALGINVDDETMGAGEGERPAVGTGTVLTTDATIAIQIYNTDDDCVVARGYFKLFNEDDADYNHTVLNSLKVKMLHGYHYSVEATIFGNYSTQCDTKGTDLLLTDANTDSKVDNTVLTDAESWTTDEQLSCAYTNLAGASLDKKGVRFYFKKSDYVAEYPSGENDGNIDADLKLCSYKVTYAFKNFPENSTGNIATELKDINRTETFEISEGFKVDEEIGSKTKGLPVVNVWYEIAPNEEGTYTETAANGISVILNDPDKDRELLKTKTQTFEAGKHYYIKSDFGIEADLDITVDKTSLEDTDIIDMNNVLVWNMEYKRWGSENWLYETIELSKVFKCDFEIEQMKTDGYTIKIGEITTTGIVWGKDHALDASLDDSSENWGDDGNKLYRFGIFKDGQMQFKISPEFNYTSSAR